MCSPFKNSRVKLAKKRGSKYPTRPQEKLYVGPTVGRPTCSEYKKKENIFCPACTEQYEEPITED
jgi:hypothetical protein